MLRVWAIWGLKNRVLAVLLLTFVVSQLPSTVVVSKGSRGLQVIENPLPGILTGCTVLAESSLKTNWSNAYLGIIGYEATLFALTLLRAWILRTEGADTPIIKLLTRDGAWYFMVAIGSASLAAIGARIPKTRDAALASE
ncbi:hypothetical protein FRC08_005461 [Ceratobasidium sp. 394]|nr:hypothetical protein FRC08_005461 [Ceratobasidium sp. 394]